MFLKACSHLHASPQSCDLVSARCTARPACHHPLKELGGYWEKQYKWVHMLAHMPERGFSFRPRQ